MTASAADPDPGAARSRTVLAWQRTALSVAAGTLLLVRLGYDELGPAVLLALLGLPLAAWVVLHGARTQPGLRAGRTGRAGRAGGAGRVLPTGLAGALLALAITALCLVELLVLADPS